MAQQNKPNPPLYAAVRMGQLKVVEQLAASADQDTRDNALILALLKEKDEVAKALLTAKADPCIVYKKDQSTTLMIAIRKGLLNLVPLLLNNIPSSHKAAVLNHIAKDQVGSAALYNSALKLAIFVARDQMSTKILLEAKADPNGKNTNGEIDGQTTPLHHALSVQGDSWAAELLLEHKAEPGLEDRYGFSAVKFATQALQVQSSKKQPFPDEALTKVLLRIAGKSLTSASSPSPAVKLEPTEVKTTRPMTTSTFAPQSPSSSSSSSSAAQPALIPPMLPNSSRTPLSLPASTQTLPSSQSTRSQQVPARPLGFARLSSTGSNPSTNTYASRRQQRPTHSSRVPTAVPSLPQTFSADAKASIPPTQNQQGQYAPIQTPQPVYYISQTNQSPASAAFYQPRPSAPTAPSPSYSTYHGSNPGFFLNPQALQQQQSLVVAPQTAVVQPTYYYLYSYPPHDGQRHSARYF